MTVEFWICLPDRGSHLLIACSLCFGLKCVQSFLKEELPATGGSMCLSHCLEGSSFGCYFEIQNWWMRGGKRFVSVSLLHSSLFPNIYLHPGFPAFSVLSVPPILLFFSLLLFQFRNSFFPKHVLPSTSHNKTSCSAVIYAETQIFTAVQHHPLFSFTTKGRKKHSELNQREVCSWETGVWICKLMTNFPKYLPTPSYI